MDFYLHKCSQKRMQGGMIYKDLQYRERNNHKLNKHPLNRVDKHFSQPFLFNLRNFFVLESFFIFFFKKIFKFITILNNNK